MLLQDVRFAFRMLRKNPGFTAIVVVTLALGIGSNATVYSAARVFMLAPLPGLREPDRLVRLVEVPPQREGESGEASPGGLFEWRRQSSTFEDIAACDEVLLNVTGSAEPELLAKRIAPFRVTTGMLVAFALLALLLAGLGIYGVISFAVARRTQEIGIRVALGAQRADVLGLIVGQGLRMALIGLGIGLAGALALSRGMASILFAVSPTDPVTLAAAASLLVAVALLASYLPARQAADLDPLAALRSE